MNVANLNTLCNFQPAIFGPNLTNLAANKLDIINLA